MDEQQKIEIMMRVQAQVQEAVAGLKAVEDQARKTATAQGVYDDALKKHQSNVDKLVGKSREYGEVMGQSFQRSTIGLTQFTRGMLMLSQGNDSMEKMVRTFMLFNATLDTFRGAKNILVGLFDTIKSGVAHMDALGRAQDKITKGSGALSGLAKQLGYGVVAPGQQPSGSGSALAGAMGLAGGSQYGHANITIAHATITTLGQGAVGQAMAAMQGAPGMAGAGGNAMAGLTAGTVQQGALRASVGAAGVGGAAGIAAVVASVFGAIITSPGLARDVARVSASWGLGNALGGEGLLQSEDRTNRQMLHRIAHQTNYARFGVQTPELEQYAGQLAAINMPAQSQMWDIQGQKRQSRYQGLSMIAGAGQSVANRGFAMAGEEFGIARGYAMDPLGGRLGMSGGMGAMMQSWNTLMGQHNVGADRRFNNQDVVNAQNEVGVLTRRRQGLDQQLANATPVDAERQAIAAERAALMQRAIERHNAATGQRFILGQNGQPVLAPAPAQVAASGWGPGGLLPNAGLGQAMPGWAHSGLQVMGPNNGLVGNIARFSPWGGTVRNVSSLIFGRGATDNAIMGPARNNVAQFQHTPQERQRLRQLNNAEADLNSQSGNMTNAEFQALQAQRRQALEDEVAARQRLLGLTQQQREAEVGRVTNMRNMARENELHFEREARNLRGQALGQQSSMGLQMRHQQQRTLRIAQRLSRGENIGRSDLAFAQGQNILAPFLEEYGRRRGAATGNVAQQIQALDVAPGLPSAQGRIQQAEDAAGRFREDRIRLDANINNAITVNANANAQEIAQQLQPVFQQLIRALQQQVDNQLRQLEFQRTVQGPGGILGVLQLPQ